MFVVPPRPPNPCLPPLGRILLLTVPLLGSSLGALWVRRADAGPRSPSPTPRETTAPTEQWSPGEWGTTPRERETTAPVTPSRTEIQEQAIDLPKPDAARSGCDAMRTYADAMRSARMRCGAMDGGSCADAVRSSADKQQKTSSTEQAGSKERGEPATGIMFPGTNQRMQQKAPASGPELAAFLLGRGPAVSTVFRQRFPPRSITGPEPPGTAPDKNYESSPPGSSTSAASASTDTSYSTSPSLATPPAQGTAPTTPPAPLRAEERNVGEMLFRPSNKTSPAVRTSWPSSSPQAVPLHGGRFVIDENVVVVPPTPPSPSITEQTLADHFHPHHPFYAPSHPLSLMAVEAYKRYGSDRLVEDSRVKLHVYKLKSFAGSVNEQIGFGLYHVSLEVYGLDFHYGYCDDDLSGVMVRSVQRDYPKLPALYEPYWTVKLGRVGVVAVEENSDEWVDGECCRFLQDRNGNWVPGPLSGDEGDVPVGMRRVTLRDVAFLARRFLRAYPASAYHPTKRNCFTFVEEFLGRLRMGGVHGEFKVPSPQGRIREPTPGEGWESPESSQMSPPSDEEGYAWRDRQNRPGELIERRSAGAETGAFRSLFELDEKAESPRPDPGTAIFQRRPHTSSSAVFGGEDQDHQYQRWPTSTAPRRTSRSNSPPPTNTFDSRTPRRPRAASPSSRDYELPERASWDWQHGDRATGGFDTHPAIGRRGGSVFTSWEMIGLPPEATLPTPRPFESSDFPRGPGQQGHAQGSPEAGGESDRKDEGTSTQTPLMSLSGSISRRLVPPGGHGPVTSSPVETLSSGSKPEVVNKRRGMSFFSCGLGGRDKTVDEARPEEEQDRVRREDPGSLLSRQTRRIQEADSSRSPNFPPPPTPTGGRNRIPVEPATSRTPWSPPFGGDWQESTGLAAHRPPTEEPTAPVGGASPGPSAPGQWLLMTAGTPPTVSRAPVANAATPPSLHSTPSSVFVTPRSTARSTPEPPHPEPVCLVSNDILPPWVDARYNDLSLFLVDLWAGLAKTGGSVVTASTHSHQGGGADQSGGAVSGYAGGQPQQRPHVDVGGLSGGLSARSSTSSGPMPHPDARVSGRPTHFFSSTTVSEVCGTGEKSGVPTAAPPSPQLASSGPASARSWREIQELLDEDRISQHRGQYWYMI